MIATLALACPCGSCYSLATFEDERVKSIGPDNTVDEWLKEHISHGEIQNGQPTLKLRLLGYVGKDSV